MWTPTHLLQPVAALQIDIDRSFLRARDILRKALPTAEIHHVGSTAIADLWTRGVVDIALVVAGAERETSEKFVHGSQALRDLPLPIHVQVSEQHKPCSALYIRQRMADAPVLVGEFLALQKSFVHQVGKPYPAAKDTFFAELCAEPSAYRAHDLLPYRIEIETPRLLVVSALACDGAAQAAYWQRNRQHLATFATVSDETSSAEHWRKRNSTEPLSHWRGLGLNLLCYRKSDQTLVGSIGFGSFAWGAQQSCALGYNIDAKAEGEGLMFESVAASIRYVFDHMAIHRVTAAYAPSNLRSAKLLERLGFRIEGHAKEYIQLGDQWHDSVLAAITR